MSYPVKPLINLFFFFYLHGLIWCFIVFLSNFYDAIANEPHRKDQSKPNVLFCRPTFVIAHPAPESL